MMDGITMTFKGQEYNIPPHRLFPIASQIEDMATLFEVDGWTKNPKFAKMAQCVAAMLRYAGAKVTQEEVWEELQAQFHAQDRSLMSSSLVALLELLMGKAPVAKEGEAPEK